MPVFLLTLYRVVAPRTKGKRMEGVNPDRDLAETLLRLAELLRQGAPKPTPELVCECQRTVERAGWSVQSEAGRLLADSLCERYDDPLDKADVEKVIELATELDVWPDTVPDDLA